MLTFPWPTLNRWPPLPAHTRRLVEAVRSGRGGELFSPVLRSCPRGCRAGRARALAGPRDAGLIAVALRDALAYVFADLPRRRWHDRRRRVQVAVDAPDRGSVAFDWPEADRRVTYAWRGARVTLDVAALGAA